MGFRSHGFFTHIFSSLNHITAALFIDKIWHFLIYKTLQNNQHDYLTFRKLISMESLLPRPTKNISRLLKALGQVLNCLVILLYGECNIIKADLTEIVLSKIAEKGTFSFLEFSYFSFSMNLTRTIKSNLKKSDFHIFC